MWPWEHAAAGYLLYSLGLRALGRDPPADGEAIVLLGGTQLPDLVDKPLSWGLGLFPSGYAVAHSAVVAVPVGLLVSAVLVRKGKTRTGVAFVVGYWSHLLGDVLSPLRGGDSPVVDRVLWPLVETTPYETDYGLRRGLVYLDGFVAQLTTLDTTGVVLAYLVVPLATAVLWTLDGTPGPRLVVRRLRGIARGN